MNVLNSHLQTRQLAGIRQEMYPERQLVCGDRSLVDLRRCSTAAAVWEEGCPGVLPTPRRMHDEYSEFRFSKPSTGRDSPGNVSGTTIGVW